MSGAELQSPGPGEPLEACRTALLRLHHNGVSPAPWDAKLGLQVGDGDGVRCIMWTVWESWRLISGGN